MKVSVIIPAHNEEQNIANAVRALLVQDYPLFEVIVVDNASEDNTAFIASQFPVTVLHEKNKGTMWACETGRKHATGQIIARMDADCIPHKSWLSQSVKYFNDPRVVAVSGSVDYHDANAIFRSLASFTQKNIYSFANHVTQKHFKIGAVMLGGNSFIRAKTLEEIGGFNTAITFYGDDTDIAKRLVKKGRVLFSPALVLKTSWRRFEREGIIRLQFKYFYHFFKRTFFN